MKNILFIMVLLFLCTAASANLDDCKLVQINSTHWYFETTQTDLADGEYNYQAFSNNISSDYCVLTIDTMWLFYDVYNTVSTDGTVTYSADPVNITELKSASTTDTVNISVNAAGAGEEYNFTINSGEVDWLNVTSGLTLNYYDLRYSNGTFIESQAVLGGSANYTTNLTTGTYIINSISPIITLISQTPSAIEQNTTGDISICYGISHSSAGLNNTSVSFIYRDYDHDLGDSNHSIRPPGNNLASEWNLDGRILRGANRNESLNFENNATITGGNTYSWGGLDENNSEMSIVSVNSTYTKLYINSTVHRIMPNMYYIDRSEIQEAPKTTIGIHKSQNVLVKFWNFEIFKGNTDFLGVGYTDTALHASSAHHPLDANPVKYYYVSSGYDPATDGDPLTSGYAIYMGSMNATEWVEYVCSPHANASYVRGFINNTLLHQYVTTTNISYVYFTSNTPSSKPFYINVTDVATSSNVSFADTNVMWAGDNVLTQQSFTPDMWFAFMKDNISFDHKIYVADNNDNWANSTLSSTMVGAGLFPPTKPSFYAFHNGFQDFDMNGTYHDTIQVQVSAGSDPDGGVVTHNITLHYGVNNTYVATINGSAVAEDGVYTNISFNTTPYYSQTENYTLKVVATDDEGETATTWLGVNFTLYVTPNATNLANTTGNFYVNYTWSAGSGATTDSYNVSINSTWYNGSSQAWANNSTAAHGSIEIIVYAYNESSGLSSGYLTDNVIVPNNNPVLSGIPYQNTNEDTSLYDVIDLDTYYSDADSDTPTFALQSNNQSANVTVDISDTNTVDFVLAANWYGTAQIIFNVSDGYGGTDNDTIILTVNSVNDPPVLDTISDINVDENVNVNIDALGTDAEGDPLTYSCNRTDLFSDFSTSTGEGNWTPTYGQSGIYPIDFGVSDGTDNDNQTVTITVNNVPLTISTYWNNISGGSLSVSIDINTAVDFGVTSSRTANNISWYNGSTFLENDTATSQGNLTHQFNSVGTHYINVSASDDYDTTSNLTFTVLVTEPSIGYYVNGTVYDYSNAGLSGVSVTLSSSSTTTGTDGTFSFSGVSDGTYTLLTYKDSFGSLSKSITVLGSDLTGQDFYYSTPPSGGGGGGAPITPPTAEIIDVVEIVTVDGISLGEGFRLGKEDAWFTLDLISISDILSLKDKKNFWNIIAILSIIAVVFGIYDTSKTVKGEFLVIIGLVGLLLFSINRFDIINTMRQFDQSVNLWNGVIFISALAFIYGFFIDKSKTSRGEFLTVVGVVGILIYAIVHSKLAVVIGIG